MRSKGKELDKKRKIKEPDESDRLMIKRVGMKKKKKERGRLRK